MRMQKNDRTAWAPFVLVMFGVTLLIAAHPLSAEV